MNWDLTLCNWSYEAVPNIVVLGSDAGTQSAQGRQLGKEDRHKVGRNSTRGPLPLVVWTSTGTAAILHYGDKPHLAQELRSWEEDPGKGETIAGPAAALCKRDDPAEPASDNLCDLQNGSCFTSAHQILPKTLYGSILIEIIQRR